ncbi:MAG TPA: thiamine-phosphate kinase [Candidatus Baltobacteraceae bacterium]|nr:thiamine-phosphate kinase [Candidatus Baltobacteraceae bacterium]
MNSEDQLVAQLRDLIESQPLRRKLASTIGDDAAVWQPSRSHRSVITTDALVEGVHFRLDAMSLHDIGWRAMASNLSDLAAMGSRPVLATVALGIPQGADTASVLDLYRGMLAVASPHDCAIAGGDLTRTPGWNIAITAVGEIRPAHVKGRAGARRGDVVAVTGPLGASRAGLHLADNVKSVLTVELQEEARQAHCRPQPRVAEGRFFAASEHVHAMMDLSDGLSTDLARLCERSKCAAIVEEVPVAQSAAAMAQALGEDPQSYALAGGEDYELLVAVNARAFGYLSSVFRKRFGRALFAVGHIREGSGLFVRKGGREESLAPTGWDHLRE